MMGQNMVQLARGKVEIVNELTGITDTTTSAEKSSRGHNSINIFLNMTAGTGTFTVKLQSKFPKSNTFMDHYDNNGDLMAFTATGSKSQFFAGIPSDFKIVATEDVNGATVTIGYELLTV